MYVDTAKVLGIGMFLASVFLFFAVWIGSGSFQTAVTVFFSALAFFTLMFSLWASS